MENTLLNLIPSSYIPEVHLSQYDVGRELKFKLMDGNTEYSVPSGASVTVKATKPSGLGFVVSGTFSGNIVTIVNTETMTNESGRFSAELSISSGATLLGTSNFIFNIERSPHPEGTTDGDAETLIPELTLLVNEIRESNAKVESMTASAESLPAGSEPTANYDPDTNNLALGIPSGEKGDKGDKGDTGAKGDKGDKGDTGDVSLAQLEEILSDYALQNGYYDELTAGSAEQLLSSKFVEDSVPYKFRTSGGSADIGNREYDEIVGGSIVWNQKVNIFSSDSTGTTNGVTVTDNRDGSYTLNGTATANGNQNASPSFNVYSGHKYLVLSPSNVCTTDTISFSVKKGSRIFAVNSNTSARLRFYFTSGESYSDVKVFPQCFDLTQMFGSQVADYIYSLEQAQSGKGVAFFKSLFPNDYYPYNAGELLSVEGLQSHDTVGFNQFDIDNANLVQGNFDAQGPSYTLNVVAMNYTEVLPNTVYNLHDTIGSQGRYLRFYNDAKELVGTASQYNATDVTFTTPSNACYMKTMWYHGSGLTVAQVQNGNVCLNLSWSGWRNGEYEPYKKHSYPLDSSLTLRGIPKIVDNKFCFDGDSYKHDGGVERRFFEVDMGTLDWTTGTDSMGLYFKSALPDAKVITSGTANMLCSIYATTSSSSVADKQIAQGTGTGKALYVRDTSYADATAFKTAMNGVMLIYELATPTEETATPFDEIQLVDDFGTEEYVSGNLVPVGHNTKYPANLRDKLQHLPNLANNDGYYMISQQNKNMSLELFRIPKAPTTDGVYTLKAHVSGGTPLYVWEADEYDSDNNNLST